MKMMKWYKNNWYYIGGILFIAQAFIMILFGSEIDIMKKFMILSFMALNIHQFEEYAFPGGFPMVMNMAFMGETEVPDRYPLNKKSAFVCNVILVYPIYILGIIFSQYYWAGLAIMFFGVAQIFVHGIAFNKKMGTIYNPGMASIVFLFIPLSILYIAYITTNFDIGLWNWIVALVLQPIVGMLCLMCPIKLMQDKNSLDIWPEHETKKFNVAKYLEKNNK